MENTLSLAPAPPFSGPFGCVLTHSLKLAGFDISYQRMCSMGEASPQSRGTLLGLLANIFTIFSTASNFWIRYPGDHSGVWQECHKGTCSNIPCQRGVAGGASAAMLAVTRACMGLAAGSSFVGLVMGLRILCHEGDWRGQTTSLIHLLGGLRLLIALTGYTVKNAQKDEVFFSWSYFSGWLALPFSVIAGFCFLLAVMI